MPEQKIFYEQGLVMRKLNVRLVAIMAVSIQFAWANCPSAASIVETNGKYSAPGLGGGWIAYGVPQSGTSLVALQGAGFTGADGSGPKEVMISREESANIPVCYELACHYKTSGGLNFSLRAPYKKYYKVTGSGWAKAADPKVYGRILYTCNSANINDCSFISYP